MNVERDDGAFAVDLKERGPATAGKFAYGTFDDPSLGEETRERSAREIGCLVRMRLKIRLRLILRGVLFEAVCVRLKLNRCIAILRYRE
jgi:hypothetical protein